MGTHGFWLGGSTTSALSWPQPQHTAMEVQ